MTNTDVILFLIAIIIGVKDCRGANYKDELREIKRELSNIRSEIRSRK